jgi:hypothetical protein
VQQKVEGQGQKLEGQEQKLERQRWILEQLVAYSMSWYIYLTLEQLYNRSRTGEEYLYRRAEMERSLRFLRDHGYLEQFTIGDLPDGKNLIGTAELTPIANFLVELRQEMAARAARSSAEHLTPAARS